jgi:hypothetical protein
MRRRRDQTPGGWELPFRNAVIAMSETSRPSGDIAIKLLDDICVTIEMIDDHVSA